MTNSTIDPTLRNVDDFPNSAQVRLPVVKGLLGVSSATVWRMVKSGKLRSYKLTERTTSFNLGEVRTLLNAQKGEG